MNINKCKTQRKKVENINIYRNNEQQSYQNITSYMEIMYRNEKSDVRKIKRLKIVCSLRILPK